MHRPRLFLIKHKKHLIAFAVFLSIASILTWPFIIRPFDTQVGANYGDIVGSISKFEAIKAEGGNPFRDTTITSLALPDGITSNVGVDRVSAPSTLFLWLLTVMFNGTFAHSLHIFLGYLVTACVMYAFLYRYTKSFWLGLFGGVVYITFPLFVSLGRAAPIYMWAWLYILPVWAYLKLYELPSRKNLLLACLSPIPGIFWTPYFLLHLSLITLACLTTYAILIYKKHRKLPVVNLAICGTSLLLILFAYAVIGLHSGQSSIPERTSVDAYEQSLHPAMLVLPTYYSVYSAPFFDSIIKPILPRGAITCLYLSLTIIALSVIGLFALIRRKHLFSHRHRILGFFGLSIAVIAFWFSLAPTISIFGINIPTPNLVVTHYVPALRAGQRLVVLIMFGLILLSTLGFKYIIIKAKRYARPLLVSSLICCLIACEFLVYFKDLSAPIHNSPAMHQLSTLKKGIVVEYLNDSINGYPGQLACKNYFIHRMPMINSCSLDIKRTPPSWPLLTKIDKDPISQQLLTLSQLSVSYYIVDNTSPQAEKAIQDLNYTLVAKDSVFRVYSNR